MNIFSMANHFSFLSAHLWETVRYRLKYCLKGPLYPNQLLLGSLPFEAVFHSISEKEMIGERKESNYHNPHLLYAQ